ncbi:MAG TPA: NnrU family protein [Burkholderiaceae bacterium]|nr:NnrU family protein [Burkholderiaceae bacterium]
MVLFLGLHSTRLVADGARSRFIARYGAGPWRGLYSLVSAIGLVLIVWGYSLTLRQPVVVYSPPAWSREVAAVLTWAAIVLIAAAYVPRNHFKAWVGHPMVLGTALWALAHLQTSSTAADVLLFGGFLVWAVPCFASLRARDRTGGVQRRPGQVLSSVIAIVVGTAAWAAFALWLHRPLIGVTAFG